MVWLLEDYTKDQDVNLIVNNLVNIMLMETEFLVMMFHLTELQNVLILVQMLITLHLMKATF